MARLPLATRLVMRLDVWSVRWTGSSFFMWLFARRAGLDKNPEFKSRKAPSLVLVTRGRKSGRRRAVVLPYFTFDGMTFVVGSKGGADEDPDWVRNLRMTPAATVYVQRKPRTVSTRFATAKERSQLWHQLVAFAPTYDGYQKGTRREIPLVLIQ
ncbi:MAG: nitroreductase family deazaflavin-dependent oxidoreductase [Proteobacteria bacterium]|nr:nitroreductase family deazaflavin-dependent oxidoreductase [Pseudomonadota bacterium]